MSIELKHAAQQSTLCLQAVCRYISDVLAGDASSSEKHIARTIMHLLPLEQAAPIQLAEAKTDKPVAVRNPFAARCYTMSESHLSGHRLIVGFEKLGDAQDAHEWVARQGRGDFTHPAPSVPDGYALVRIEPTVGMLIAGAESRISQEQPTREHAVWAAMLADK